MHGPRASPHGSASPPLSLPTLRPPRAVPHSPQVTGPALGSQGRTVPSSPDLTEAALASPTLSLPSPRASRAAPSSPALAPQLQGSVHHYLAAVDDDTAAAAATAGLCTPEAARQEQQEEAEVYVLSEIWKVFEQVIKQVTHCNISNAVLSADDLLGIRRAWLVLLEYSAVLMLAMLGAPSCAEHTTYAHARTSCALAFSVRSLQMVGLQVPATQPLLVLATCQRPPEELPPVLLNFFQLHSPAATSASCCPTQHFNNQMLTHGSTSFTVTSSSHAGTVGSSQVIVMESEEDAAAAGSWQEAVSRSAEAAAHAVAAATAFSVQQKLLEQAFAASN